MTVLFGADVVLPDRIASGLTLVLRDGRIAELASGPRAVTVGESRVDVTDHIIVPGFVDVHIHGIDGVDVLDGHGSVAAVAASLPRTGVTAFCPTSAACRTEVLEAFLHQVGEARAHPGAGSARVLPAHLESNFINAEFRGAQPLEWLCGPTNGAASAILAVVDRHLPDIGIFTLAPELDGGLDLIRDLVGKGVRVSLGHSGATFDEGQRAIRAGARHATHLFNCMRPLHHREPGLAGAILSSDDVEAELICDGHHLHAAAVRLAVGAKGVSHVIAVTDATSGAGRPHGSSLRLAGQPIVAGDVARLSDGTMAGSVQTMDRAFAWLVSGAGVDLVQAALMCSTTPARALGLHGHGALTAGGAADFVVLDRNLTVAQTWIGGAPVYDRRTA